jgi:hypothetical protein
MLRILALVAISAALYSTVIGSAASVPLNASAVQQGTDGNLLCSGTATVALLNSDGDPTELDGATVAADGCDGALAYVTVYGPGPAAIGTCTTPALSGGTASCSFGASGPSVLDAEAVTVQIIGGTSFFGQAG